MTCVLVDTLDPGWQTAWVMTTGGTIELTLVVIG